MNTDVQKLRSAIMVAKYLNISEAAHNLSFSPSAVSKHIRSLEEEMGVELFDRHSRSGVTLTNDGRTVLPALQKVVTDLDELEGLIRSLSDSPTFWIGTAPIFPSRITAAFISKLTEYMPEVQLSLLHHDNKTLLDLVRMGRLDAGISTILGSMRYNPEFTNIRDKNLLIDTIVTEEEVVLLNETHKLANKESISMNELLMDPGNTFCFVNPDPKVVSPRMRVFNEECRRRGIQCRTKIIDLELGLAMDTMKRRIARDVHYVAFVPPTPDFPGIIKRTVKDTIYTSRIVIYYMKNNRSRGLKAFLAGADVIRKNGYIE